MKGSITLSAEKIGISQIKIRVRDTGIGIDKSNIEKLFQAFSKIQNKEDFCLNAQGVGLGLLISNKLAYLLNRSETGIEVVSDLHKGSEFSFKFFDEDSVLNEDEVILSHRKSLTLKNLNFVKLISEKEKVLHTKLYESVSSEQSFENKITECLNKGNLDKCLIQVTDEKNEEIKISPEISVSSDSMISSHIRTNELMRNKIEAIKMRIRRKKCSCPYSLIIDDDDFNILSMGGRLKKMNIPFESALSGELGLQKIIKMFNENCCKFYKLVFLDLEMPQKNGIVVYEEISKFYKENKIKGSKILLVTGYSYSSDIVKHAMSRGIKNILIKPITTDHVVDIIQEII
jgi:CheY-like chemotaxis protein